MSFFFLFEFQSFVEVDIDSLLVILVLLMPEKLNVTHAHTNGQTDGVVVDYREASYSKYISNVIIIEKKKCGSSLDSEPETYKKING